MSYSKRLSYVVLSVVIVIWNVYQARANATEITVVKHVINDNGGGNVAGDFTISVNGTNPNPANFPGDENITTVSIDPGTYSVDETGPVGYASSFSADCQGEIADGETKSCVITNNDIAPRLVVKKSVVNDNGGVSQSSDFTIRVDSDAVAIVNPVAVLNRLADYFLGFFSNGMAVHVSGNDAYVVTLSPGATNRKLQVVDVSNPAAPTGVGLATFDSIPRAVAVSGNYAYVGTDTSAGNELHIYDISDPTNPTEVGGVEVNNSILAVSVVGKYLYTGIINGPDEFRIYDISDPTNPVTVGTLDFNSSITGMHVHSHYVYAISFDGTLHIIDVAIPSAPVQVGMIDVGVTGNKVFFAGHYAYVVTNNQAGNDFHIIDVTDPSNPVEVGGADLGAHGKSVVVYNYHAYVFTSPKVGNDLIVYDITNPAGPIEVAGADINSNTNTLDMFTSGGYLYVPLNSVIGALYIYDISGVLLQQPAGVWVEFPGDAAGANLLLNAGNYAVSENPGANYNVTLSLDCNGSIAIGEIKTCTVTNDDTPIVPPPTPTPTPSPTPSPEPSLTPSPTPTPTPSPTPTPTPGGGGGGGGSGGGGSGGGGGGVSAPTEPGTFAVAKGPVSEGQVLGASTDAIGNSVSCVAHFDEFAMRGRKTASAQTITNLQSFLNQLFRNTAPLGLNGLYDTSTVAAVKMFQNAHKAEVLTPWKIVAPTGNFYLTTRRQANIEYCRLQGIELNIPMPDLIPWSGR